MLAFADLPRLAGRRLTARGAGAAAVTLHIEWSVEWLEAGSLGLYGW